METKKIPPKYLKELNPKIGLIALSSDYMIEKDFIKVIKDKKIDFFVNRIETFNPLTSENLIKMSEKITEVTKNILPDEKIDCVAYGCTSGTIAAGYNSIEEKIKKAKPNTSVTTPSTAAVNALKKLDIKKIYLFTPYPKKLNDEVIEFFKKEGFEVSSNSYFDIASDIDIGKVDPEYLYEVLSNINLDDADALFISCTALPALSIIDRLKRLYPDSKCSLNYDSPFQLLVATVLSAQCTDERVNKVTKVLFQKYPEAIDFAIIVFPVPGGPERMMPLEFGSPFSFKIGMTLMKFKTSRSKAFLMWGFQAINSLVF